MLKYKGKCLKIHQLCIKPKVILKHMFISVVDDDFFFWRQNLYFWIHSDLLFNPKFTVIIDNLFLIIVTICFNTEYPKLKETQKSDFEQFLSQIFCKLQQQNNICAFTDCWVDCYCIRDLSSLFCILWLDCRLGNKD